MQKKALIAASSRGPGAASAQRFAADGFDVAAAIAWLLLDKSSYAIGALSDVAGGK